MNSGHVIKSHTCTGSLHYIVIGPPGDEESGNYMAIIPGPPDLFAQFDTLVGREAEMGEGGRLSFSISSDEFLRQADPRENS